MSAPTLRGCSAPDCPKPHYGRGLCAMHLARIRRRGDLSRAKAGNGERLAWVLRNIEATAEECVQFPFPIGSHGYGEITANGKCILAHLFVCSLEHGPAPDGQQAAHSCGNKRCINPQHLRWATRSENESDKLVHGTHNRGERHNLAKLSESQVLAIREANGSQRDVAKYFDVAQQTVSDIKTGRRWSWLQA